MYFSALDTCIVCPLSTFRHQQSCVNVGPVFQTLVRGLVNIYLTPVNSAFHRLWISQMNRLLLRMTYSLRANKPPPIIVKNFLKYQSDNLVVLGVALRAVNKSLASSSGYKGTDWLPGGVAKLPLVSSTT